MAISDPEAEAGAPTPRWVTVFGVIAIIVLVASSSCTGPGAVLLVT